MGAVGADVARRRRERLELRTIVVSTIAAYRHVVDAQQRDRVKSIADDMLRRLEERVTRDGADPELLREIDAARRRLNDRYSSST